ncbi:type IV secretion system DNA-binding domain-containing protein [Candidatus Peregrinibacteria bacterium]|nr:type IV secretion system DNA-binding domain-containing protein [Candidatus Peregrinibacteria bacterium]
MFLKRFQKRSIIKPFILNTEEVATLWHLPNNTVNTPNIQWVQSNKLEAPLNLPQKSNTNPNDFTALGNTNFRLQKSIFGIKRDDRRRHMYIIGKTGMGKSTILENMIVSDIANGKGVAVIDPHGDLAEAILNFIPKSRTNDVMIFNPSDTDHPVSFNMLECKIPEQRYLVASGLLGVFKKMFGESWGPRLEHILRNTILALTENPGSTILGIMRMLTDDTFRKKMLKNVQDPMVQSFWKDEFGRWNEKQKAESVSPIQNKVGQFLSSPLIRNVFGQPKSSVDLRFLMDKQKIVIINLSKGKIGDDNSSLLGSMMITKFQLDAMSRADIPEEKRVDFYLYVDEFQNFATDSFAVILSEARKYKLNLTMANQYIEQMSEEVKAALFGNVGTLMACQLGAEDAEIFSKQFSEIISANDIVNLPKYQCYIKLMIDGMPSSPFSANTLPPPSTNQDFAEKDKILKISRERYAKKREFVEGKIQEWMGK